MLETVYLHNYLFNLAYFPEINDDDNDGNEDMMMIKTLS